MAFSGGASLAMLSGQATAAAVANGTTNVDVDTKTLMIVMCQTKATSATNGSTNTQTLSDNTSGKIAWTKIGEWNNAGACNIALWYGIPNQTITASITISSSFSSAANRIIEGFYFSFQGTVSLAGSNGVVGVDANTNPGSIAVSSLTSKEYLAFRVLGTENVAGTTPRSISANSSGWTNWSGAGVLSASPKMLGEWDIATATSFTSAPTLNNTADSAGVMGVLLDTYAPPVGNLIAVPNYSAVHRASRW